VYKGGFVPKAFCNNKAPSICHHVLRTQDVLHWHFDTNWTADPVIGHNIGTNWTAGTNRTADANSHNRTQHWDSASTTHESGHNIRSDLSKYRNIPQAWSDSRVWMSDSSFSYQVNEMDFDLWIAFEENQRNHKIPLSQATS
jgi:hypothetical protein